MCLKSFICYLDSNQITIATDNLRLRSLTDSHVRPNLSYITSIDCVLDRYISNEHAVSVFYYLIKSISYLRKILNTMLLKFTIYLLQSDTYMYGRVMSSCDFIIFTNQANLPQFPNCFCWILNEDHCSISLLMNILHNSNESCK